MGTLQGRAVSNISAGLTTVEVVDQHSHQALTQSIIFHHGDLKHKVSRKTTMYQMLIKRNIRNAFPDVKAYICEFVDW